MWNCKHCKNEFDFKITSEKANHSRWCKKNPKYQEILESTGAKNSEKINERLGCLKEFKVTCHVCADNFIVKEREKLFDATKIRHCSYKCSNSYGGKARAKLLEEQGKLHYTVIAFRHHPKQCIICGFDKIVTVHHYDEDHSNNDPNNLVPLCPNHHQMFHSKYRDEVEDRIDEYVRAAGDRR